MRQKKLLNKALSFLLSGAMLAGSIPAAYAEDYDLPLLDADKAGTVDHTYSGYVSLWDESFDDFTDGIGSGWTTKDKDGDGYDWGVALAPTLSHCGDRLLVSGSSYWIKETNEDVPLDPDNWLYSPLIELPEGNEYMLTFDAKGKGNTFGVFIAVGRYSTNYVQIGSDYTIATYDWTEYTIDLSEYAGKYIHLAFVHYNSTSDHDLYLDCVNISNKPKGYTKVNSWGFEDVEFDGESIIADVPSGFIAADKDEDGYTWEVLKADWNAHTGECYLRSRRKSADVVADNWLRLPQLRLDNDKDYLLTFYVTDSFAYQTVDVYLYGDDCYDGKVTPEDLEGDGITEYYSKVLTEDIDVVGSISGWHEVKVDLSDYAGQYVYAAIVQHGGQGEMCVDDIALWQRAAHTPEGDRTNVYFEGFENEDKKLPEGWETFNKDGDSYNWNACYGGSDKIHHGKGGVYSNSYNGGALTPDNWLVMPSYKVSTTMKTTLTFEAVGSHYEDYNEVFGVFISVDGGEFEQIGKDYTANYAWQEVEVDLTPYAGKSVRVAVVHHNCTDQESLILDCFNIWEETFPPIKKADITLPKPTIGEAVPTTDFSDVKVNVEEYGISVSAFAGKWQKLSKEVFQSGEYSKYEEIADGEKFSKDYVYFLDVPFKIDECYTFADSKDITLTVNGISDYYVRDKTTSGNYLRVFIIFYPFEAYITDVSATVTEPVVGAVPDTSPVVKFTPDKELLHVAMWSKAPKEDYTTYAETEWEPISDPTEKFAEGYVYAVVIAAANQGMEQYEFTPATTVSINGKTAFPMENAEDGYYMSPALIGGAAVFDLSSTKPQNVKATPGDGQVTLTWDKVPGATKYATYYYLGGKYTSAGQTTGTSLTVKGLTNGTKYGFLVIAYVDGAWSSYTTEDLVYATPNSTKPKFTATAGDGQVTLNWSAVTGATKYATYYYLDGKYTSAGQTIGTSLTVKGLTNGTKYGFLVIAYVDGAWTSFTTADLVYATPVGSSKPVFTATPGNGQVTLNWSAVTGATKYATYYYLDGKYTSAGQTTGTSLTVKGLTNGTKYGFLVIAYVGGSWTSFTTADLVYATPVGSSKPVFTATPGNGQVTLNWSAVTGATKYATYYYLGGKYTSAGQTTGTSLTVKGLTNGTKYGFLVIAYVGGSWTSYTTADLVYATPVGSSKPVFTATPGNGQVTLNWSVVTGATKYATYYYLGGKYTSAGQTTGTSLTVKGLTNGTKYGFLVIAYVNGAWTSFTTADLVYATPTT